MKIAVLGGSPKGDRSVTMQYVEYMKLRSPELEYEIHQPALRIRRLVKHPEEMNGILDSVRSSDAVLWAFPLYVHGVCSQYQKFIELIDERNVGEVFRGTPAAVFTTSINFFDNTAVDYMQAVCEDLEMPWIGGYSAHMRDLTSAAGRRGVDGFIRTLSRGLSVPLPRSRYFPALPLSAGERSSASEPDEEPSTGNRIHPISQPGLQTLSVGTDRSVAIITDSMDGRIGTMVRQVSGLLAGAKTRVVNLRKIRIAGGCLGCLKCGPKNRCSWDGKDDIRRVYEEILEPADIVIYAAEVKGRWHSALMKSFIDRGFFHTHQPYLSGKQVLVLLDGSLAGNPPLKDFLTAFFQWQGANLSGIAAASDTDDIAGLIRNLAGQTVMAMEHSIPANRMFPGIAGMNLFRDEIFGHLGMVFRADHRSYRRSGLYRTMAHAQPLRLLGYRIIAALVGLPPVRKRMTTGMRDFMLMPFRGVLRRTGAMEI